ncbi:hypothetical protein INS49_008786 [Diaporthe citri]|uniref:uncharacterized protein n=1 Tax=Diaporthe citri TaxID=83186 RepID=UPI001C7EB554|nr:uncharacterized protein INS49_008786 [Diaporthe citri]KAG6363685.1 hypothetical protein INS49_008786 [Diaporthe citri]
MYQSKHSVRWVRANYEAVEITLPGSLSRTASEEKYVSLYWDLFLPKCRDRTASREWTRTSQSLFRTEPALRSAVLAVSLGMLAERENCQWMGEEGVKAYGKALLEATAALKSPSRVKSDALNMEQIIDGIKRRKRTSLSRDEWKTVPWTKHAKGTKDQLLDILVEVPGFFEDVDNCESLADPEMKHEEYRRLVATCLSLHAQLQAWYGALPPGQRYVDTSGLGVEDERAIEELPGMYTMLLYWATCLYLYNAMRVHSQKRPASVPPFLSDIKDAVNLGQYVSNMSRLLPFFFNPNAGKANLLLAAFPLGTALQFMLLLKGQACGGDTLPEEDSNQLMVLFTKPEFKPVMDFLNSLQRDNDIRGERPAATFEDRVKQRAGLVTLLQESQIPDTQRVKAVTAELQKNFYSKPESLLLLVEIVCTSEDVNLRQQAAVQAARLVPKYWEKIPAEQKAGVRQHLVEATMKEQHAKCRHSESRVIAAIASLDLDDSAWPDLIPSLFTLASNSDVSHREVGSYIIYAILDENPTHFAEKVRDLLSLFSNTIKDPQSADVRVNTVMSIGAVLMLVEPEEDEAAVTAVQQLISPMVNVLKDAVESNDDEKTKQSFEVFQQFLAYEPVLLGSHLRDLMAFMAELAANKNADDEVRCQALAFLAQAVRYRRMKVQGMKDMGSQLTLKSMEILTEIDDDEDEDEITPARAALSLLDQLASDLPPRQVIVPLLDALPKFASSAEPGFRKSGVLALGTVAEGAPDFVSTQLKMIMPIVLRLLNDPDAGVRHTALIGLTRIADEMAEELSDDRDALVEALLKNIQAASAETSDADVAKKNVEIMRCSCAALDALASGFDSDVMQKYGPELITPIGNLLSHPDFKVKGAAAGALGAIAGAMEEHFAPYFENTMTALGPFIQIKDSEDELELRSGVCDAMGRIATAVGPQKFQPYVLELMKASEEALNLGNPRLRETSFILWSALSKVYGKEFAPFIAGVFKGLFDSLELEEEELVLNLSEEEKAIIGTEDGIIQGGRKIKIREPEEGEEAMEDDGFEDEDDDDWGDYGVTPEAMEKEVAIEVLGDVVTHACGLAEISQYLEKALENITPLVEHSYEGCRKAAISTLWRSYARVYELFEEQTGTKWEAGFPPKQAPSETLTKLGEIVSAATLKLWPDETDRNVVTDINRNVAATLKACGPAILTQDKMVEQTVTVLTTLITRSHPCQQDLGDEEEQDADAGSSEYDWLIIDTALDVVIGLAAAMGSQFGELWKIFEKPVMKFASSQEDLERSTSVGVIAECAAHMGAAVSPYTPAILKLLLKRLTDPDPETKSNAAYATGQLIYHSTDANTYLPSYTDILTKLEPMLSIDHARLKDNATGCVCRMIISHPDRMPIADVLPVLVGLLPLKEDFEENNPVYECLYKLYEANEPTVQSLTPKLIGVFEKVLSPPEEQLQGETRQLVQRIVQSLYKAKPELFQGHEQVLKVSGAA